MGADIRLLSVLTLPAHRFKQEELIKALLEAIGHEDAKNPYRIAYLAYLAEVCEFNNPGGMMDHYTSALGGLVHLD
ncbi:MAG: hypothetical protein GX541_04350, partial [Clostridiales bacterium]|nr:hypothetical protein [Clostridiales bacterium]